MERKFRQRTNTSIWASWYRLVTEWRLKATQESHQRAFWALERFLRSDMPNYHKKRLFDSCVLSVLTNGCQSWAVTDALKEKLAVEQKSMERKMLKISWTDKISNVKLRKQTKLIDVNVKAKTIKWRWAGHIQRYPDNRWPKTLENWIPIGVRKKGRTARRWKQEIEDHASTFWRRKAENRVLWKTLQFWTVHG